MDNRSRPSVSVVAVGSGSGGSGVAPSPAPSPSRPFWAKFCTLMRLDQTFALPALMLYLIATVVIFAAVPAEGASPLQNGSTAAYAYTFIGAFWLGCLFTTAIAVASSSYAQRVPALSSVLILSAMCAFHCIFLSSGAAPVVFVRSLGGSSAHVRPQIPQQLVFWICSTMPLFVALGQEVHASRMLVRAVGAAVLGELCAAIVVTYTENFALWVTMFIIDAVLFLFAMTALVLMLARARSGDNDFSRLMLRLRIVSLLSWSAFPMLWMLGQWDLVTPAVEWTVWPVVDIAFKGSMALTFALVSFRELAQAAHDALGTAVSQRAFAQATKDDTSRQFLRWTLHELRVPLQGAVLALDEVLEFLRSPDGEQRLPPSPAALVDNAGTPTSDSKAQQHTAACEAGDTAMTAIGTVTHILDSFLSLAKIEDGRLTLEPFEMLLRPWLAEVTSSFTNALRTKGLTLGLRFGTGVPDIIFADGNRLRQVVANFLSNAIKFSPQGGREVVVRVECVARLPAVASAADGSSEAQPPLQLIGCRSAGEASRVGTVPFLRVAVRDGGAGISAEDVPLLFLPYSQIRAGVQQAGGGTGLGLALCKKIVELAGGAVGVESEPGAGACFWFEVPCSTSAARAVVVLGVSPPPPGAAAFATPATPAPIAYAADNVTAAEAGASAATRVPMPPAPAIARLLLLSPVRDVPSPSLIAIPAATSSPHSAWSVDASPKFAGRRSSAVVTPTIGNPSLTLVRRAVVVDDAYTNREFFARQLRRHGCDIVFTAEHGQDCLDKAAAAVMGSGLSLDDIIDAWFVDGVMPVMDGLELTRRLRALGVSAPIVAVSGNALDADVSRFRAAGATAVLSKPVMKLQETLAAVAGLRLQGSRFPGSSAPTSPSNAAV